MGRRSSAFPVTLRCVRVQYTAARRLSQIQLIAGCSTLPSMLGTQQKDPPAQNAQEGLNWQMGRILTENDHTRLSFLALTEPAASPKSRNHNKGPLSLSTLCQLLFQVGVPESRLTFVLLSRRTAESHCKTVLLSRLTLRSWPINRRAKETARPHAIAKSVLKLIPPELV